MLHEELFNMEKCTHRFEVAMALLYANGGVMNNIENGAKVEPAATKSECRLRRARSLYRLSITSSSLHVTVPSFMEVTCNTMGHVLRNSDLELSRRHESSK